MSETEHRVAEDWKIDLFAPDDAVGLVALYRAVYGDDYPVREVYDPAVLIRQMKDGVYRGVARTDKGEIVGHVAFYRSSPPNQELYEYGQLMIRQDCQNMHIGMRLTRFLLTVIPSRYGIKEVWLEAVCNHIFSQRQAAQLGFCETGLEIDLMPGEADRQTTAGHPPAEGRISTVLYFRLFQDRPQTIYLPPVYAEVLRSLYSGFACGHTFLSGDAALPDDNRRDRSSIVLFAGAGVARLTFTEMGGDFAQALENMEKQAQEAGVTVTQVFLPLTIPWTGAAVEVLRQRGYFLGGYLPRWFGDDGLLMQKVAGEPNFSGIHLFSTRARQLLEWIQADWRSVSREQHP